ncbi:reverse transcriptase domain-containing protein [Trichonephila clavipes]|nr:reverse transcriptase domain-containing protein [Trichonephila clavipes]
MWSMVAQRLTQITPPAATPDQLWQRVEAAWSAVPEEHIQSLFESMPRQGSPTSIPEDTFMPYSEFEPEPTGLHADCHSNHTRKNGTLIHKGSLPPSLLFNVALEQVIRDSNINTRGKYLKSIQLLDFADDIDVIARTPTALRQAFLSFEEGVLRMELKINENKTKYMPWTKSSFTNPHFKIEEQWRSYRYINGTGPQHV